MRTSSWLLRLLAVAAIATSTAATVAAQDTEPQAAAAAAPGPAAAPQEKPDPNAGSIKVVVLDQTGAAIVGATVSVVPANAASGTEAKSAAANDQGEATIEHLAPGKYVVQIESVGFETKQIADVNVRRGRQERREIQLPIAGYVEEVEVTRDKTDQNITDNFSSALTQDQIDALPDDEDEMASQLEQMAGPGAVLRVNGFSGGRLPPKSQIAEIRFRFDPYSAENHEAGFPRVDIRTRPGNGNWRNNATATFRDESLNARNAFATEKPPEQARRYQVLDGRPDQEGQDVVLVQRRRPGRVRDRDHPRGQPRRHAVRRRRVAADRPRQLQRPRRARHQQEPDAARRVLAQQQRPGAARRRRLRPLRARLRSAGPRQRSADLDQRSGVPQDAQRGPPRGRLERDGLDVAERRQDHQRQGGVHDGRRADRRRPEGEDPRVRRQPRLRPRQEARAPRRRARRRRLVPQRRDTELQRHLHVLLERRLPGRAAAAVLGAHRRPAGRIPLVPVRRLPAGRLPRPEEPARELRASATRRRRT